MQQQWNDATQATNAQLYIARQHSSSCLGHVVSSFNEYLRRATVHSIVIRLLKLQETLTPQETSPLWYRCHRYATQQCPASERDDVFHFIDGVETQRARCRVMNAFKSHYRRMRRVDALQHRISVVRWKGICERYTNETTASSCRENNHVVETSIRSIYGQRLEARRILWESWKVKHSSIG